MTRRHPTRETPREWAALLELQSLWCSTAMYVVSASVCATCVFAIHRFTIFPAMNPAAKRILVSYSHDSDEHRRLVRQLADSLKENGFEVSFDQYLPEDPPEGWPLWMEK